MSETSKNAVNDKKKAKLEKKQMKAAKKDARKKESNVKVKTKKVKNGKKKSKVGVVNRMGFKITLALAAAVIVASVVSMLIVLPKSIDAITESSKNEMLSLASAYKSQLNAKLLDLKGVLSFDGYNNVLGNAKVQGAENSFAYVVDTSKIMQYCPNQDNVGMKVENNKIVDMVVEQINRGNKPDTAVVEYEFEGAKQFGAYAVLSNDSILIVTAVESEVLSSITTMSWIASIGCVLIVVICSILGWILSHYLVKPIAQLIGVIDETARLDFSDDTAARKSSKRKDEVGMIGKAVLQMREQLREMVIDIKSCSKTIYEDVGKVNDVSSTIREKCMDNSATTEELAAGMEETSATTTAINDNIEGMQKGAEDILGLSKSGVTLSREITERADSLKESTEVAAKRTTEMYGNIKDQTAKAMEAAESVKRINAMTESIMQISSQTSLLALNASIEAARAGEAGKGFSVVASEIGKLANETSDSVNDINNIVSEVNASVAEMVHNMDDTTQFLEKVVLNDYAQFKSVSEQYSADADDVKVSMSNVENAVNQLNTAIQSIAEAIEGINSTIDESTVGVTDIAEKTSNVVDRTAENASLVDACVKAIDRLEELAAKFKL